MLETALRYLASGLSIAPTKNNQKNPALKSWTKYQTVKPTVEEVTQWFSDKDVTGIGVFCGEVSNLIIVDDDSYKKGNPLELSSPLEVKTATGGRHIYFKYSPDISSHNFSTVKYDFEVRSNGVFCVMPPSVAMNKNGKLGKYEWLKTEQAKIDLLPTLGKDFTAEYYLDKPPKIDLSELLEVDLGQQHHYLRTLINSLLFRSSQDSWEMKIKPLIIEAAKRYNPPHPPHRVEKLWQDCTNYVLGKKQEKLSAKSLRKISSDRRAERVLEKSAPKTGYPSLDNLIRGFIPGHLYVVTGDTNVGKTSVSANFAVNVAEAGGKVVYFALEPSNTVIDYLDTVAHGVTYDEIDENYEDYTNENIMVYTQDQISSIAQMESALRSMGRQDLVIIDHIGYFINAGGSETNQFVSNSIKSIIKTGKEQGTAMMIIAHVRKDYKGMFPSMNDISGSGAFKQDATDVIIVAREKDESSRMGELCSDNGFMIVEKTKNGRNGHVNIKFKDRSAKIYEPGQEPWTPPF